MAEHPPARNATEVQRVAARFADAMGVHDRGSAPGGQG
jgi:hypothetical protein